MKKLRILLLAIIFVVSCVGNVFAQDSDYELVFKGPLNTEYLDTSSIRLASTDKGLDITKVAVWIKIEYTNEGIEDRINMYKKYHGNDDAYNNFAYSYNCDIYDMDKEKYTTIRYIDYDKYGNIISDSSKVPNKFSWFNISTSHNYTLSFLRKFVAQNYDTVYNRSKS